MAYDAQRGSYEQSGYRDDYPDHRNTGQSTDAPYSPPYPSQYGADQVQMPQPRMPSPPPMPASQSSSTASLSSNPHGHLNDAVASAVNKADTSAYLAPDVISQITATVIQQLKAYGLDNLHGQHNQQSGPAPSNAPDSSPSATGRTIHTPPSENHDYDSSPPPTMRTAQPGKGSPSLGHSTERKSSPSQYSDGGLKEPRPHAAARVSTPGEMTTLEKIWGKLFVDGKPTTRLSQFLRGIAVHLIEHGPGGNTIVITPEKMQKFYRDTLVSLDTYPWQDIFDDHTSSISRLYREVEAEHHLVQEKLNERPDIPGLTPRGFERWATLMILAHPERELARLQKAVLDMPISNPDDKRERFPKEISRRLFPKSPDLEVRKKLEQAIVTHCEVDLLPIAEKDLPKNEPQRKQPTEKVPPPPPTNAVPLSTETSTTTTIGSERGRQEFPTQSGILRDDEDGTIPPRPIERERKPYSAQPGGGKVYDGGAEIRPGQTDTGSNAPKSKEHYPPPPGVASSSATSTHRNSQPYETGYIRTTTGMAASQPQQNRPGRTRSTSVTGSGDYRRSDTDLSASDLGPGYGGLKSTPSLPPDVDEPRRYREYDLDDSRTYDAPRERERDRERERRYQDHRHTWSEDDYYRGLLGGQGGGPVVDRGERYEYRPSYGGYRS